MDMEHELLTRSIDLFKTKLRGESEQPDSTSCIAGVWLCRSHAQSVLANCAPSGTNTRGRGLRASLRPVMPGFGE